MIMYLSKTDHKKQYKCVIQVMMNLAQITVEFRAIFCTTRVAITRSGDAQK